MAAIDERELERQVTSRVLLIGVVFLPVIGAFNALTILTDARRAGLTIDAREPWILESTSILLLVLLVPMVSALERRFPVLSNEWRLALLVHAAGSIAFSVLHVAGMTALRWVAFPLFLGRSYDHVPNPVTDGPYEYRKDVLLYALVVLLLGLVRNVLEARRELEVAKADARETGRLTLKSGGRTLAVDAASFSWVEAAGNYVEVHAGGRTLLVRSTLKAIEQQLDAAGISLLRIHRSRIVNAARVVETKTGGDGDFTMVLDEGTSLRGSRRYRCDRPGSAADARRS